MKPVDRETLETALRVYAACNTISQGGKRMEVLYV